MSETGQTCENCAEHPAVGRSLDDVPLCRRCADEIAAAAGQPTTEDQPEPGADQLQREQDLLELVKAALAGYCATLAEFKRRKGEA